MRYVTVRTLQSEESLRSAIAERFPAVPDQAYRLWLDVATVCEVEPTQLDEDTLISQLCPAPRSVLIPNVRLEALEALVMEKSRHLAAPKKELTTIGDILRYLLETD